MSGGTYTGDKTLDPARYSLNESLTIESGTLTVPACTVIYMGSNATIRIGNGGALKLLGTAECPVRLTSRNAEPAPGDWSGIEIYESSAKANVFTHAIIEYAGASYGAVWVDANTSLAMSHSTISHSRSIGLQVGVGAELPDFVDNSITHSGTYPIEIYASEVHYVSGGTFSDNGQNAIRVIGGVITEEVTWHNLGVPYIADSFSITNDGTSASLTLQPGVVLKLNARATISVNANGSLKAEGTATEPVVITSANASPAPGDWNSIEVYSTATSNGLVFEHAIVEYGGGDGYGALWLDVGASISITNSTIRRSAHVGVQATHDSNRFRAFSGNVITENARPLEVHPNMVADIGAGDFTGNDDDIIEVVDGGVERNSTWRPLGVPYRANHGFWVGGGDSNAVLTVEAGTTIMLGSDAVLRVYRNGGLTFDGSAEARITITSDDDPPNAGDWGHIEIYEGSVGAANRFRYVDIEYGGGGGYGQLWLDRDARVSLDNVTFSNSGMGCDIDAHDEAILEAVNSDYELCE